MRRFALVVLAAAAVLAPVGCGGSTTATTSGSPGDSPEYRQQMMKERQKGGDTRGTAR
jgi:hypothetical protein